MRRALAPLALLAFTACSGDDDPGTTPTEPVEVELTVEPGPLAGVMIATVTTNVESAVELEYGLTDTIGSHPELSNGGTEHRFVVLGLKADQEYQFEAVALANEGSERSSVVTGKVDAVLPEVPSFTATTNDATNTCSDGGYFKLVWIREGHSGVTIVDRDGDVVWSLPLVDRDVQASRAHIGADGTSIVYTTADALRRDLVGEIVVQPLDGSEPTVTSTPTAHHDFVQLPEGRLAWLGYDFGTYECEDGSTLDNAAVDTIEEADPGGSSTVVYNMFDDYTAPLDCTAGSTFFLPGRYDLSHSNSLMYRESDDSYFHMMRWHDALVKVDRSSGEVQWQLGGVHDDFSPAPGEDPANLFTHGHMSDVWDGGMLVFDNNDPGPSWVRQYRIDEGMMEWEQEWSWNSGGFELLLGDARRMAGCSNVLVTQSTTGIVRELVRDDTAATVWQLEAESGTIITRVEFIPDLYDLASAELPTGG